MNKTTTVAQASERFESEPCSRCGGTGEHSYCPRYGTKCFRCGGKARTLTKRGAAAAEYLRRLRSKPAAELKVGDRIRVIAVTFGGDPYHQWETIKAIESRDGALDITTDKCRHLVQPASVYRVAFTEDAARESFKAALAYQDTLTKAGTPRKSGARAAVPLGHTDLECEACWPADPEKRHQTPAGRCSWNTSSAKEAKVQ